MTASPLTVRPLAPEDRPAWAALWQAYLAFYDTSLGEAVYEAAFERLLDPAETGMHGLVAEADGAPAGLAHFLFHRHVWRIEEVCYLQDLYTVPALRGRGVGRALIEAVYARADAAGRPSVYWMTQHFNAPARRLYDHVGMLTPFIKYQRP